MATILLIDDDDLVRGMLKMVLEDAGYEVREAGNGRVALNQHLDSDVDLVITDLVMPEQEGLETITVIRRSHPDLPVIAVSGGLSGRSDHLLQAARHLGALYTLPKPVQSDLLLHCVADAIESR